MWRIYAAGGASVALVLPYERLRDSLNDPDLCIGQVMYFDYEKELVRSGNTLFPMMCKRREFQYEQEVRIIKLDWKVLGDPQDSETKTTIDWNPQDHVEAIVINPYATEWQGAAIRAAVHSLSSGLENRIRDSVMKGPPR